MQEIEKYLNRAVSVVVLQTGSAGTPWKPLNHDQQRNISFGSNLLISSTYFQLQPLKKYSKYASPRSYPKY
jgi:hypothetical protein